MGGRGGQSLLVGTFRLDPAGHDDRFTDRTSLSSLRSAPGAASDGADDLTAAILAGDS